jgi:hypothetical protein
MLLTSVDFIEIVLVFHKKPLGLKITHKFNIIIIEITLEIMDEARRGKRLAC